MKILIIVPDGVGVRNYLFSSFISELEKKGAEIMIYHQISEDAVFEIKKNQNNIKKTQRIPFFVENSKARILRESLTYARLLQNKNKLKNKTIMSFWNKNQKSIKLKLLYRLSELLGYFISKSYSNILIFEKIYDNIISNSLVIKSIEKDFIDLKPDYVLNLHQRTPISAPVIAVAKKLKIKTATIIFSWDNVPKARLISRYDTYFVWSDLMKIELKLLYPEIDKNQIKVVGTPQFEFYFQNKFIKDKFIFCNEYGINPNKKIICFSSNDETSPYESNYFEDICQEIMKIDENKRPQVIFRRNPVDTSNRFDVILKKFKNLIFSIDPDWRSENDSSKSFSELYPTYNDIQLLVNIVHHSDSVINLGSTMAHDFASINKPCLYLNYNPVKNSIFKVEEIYNFQHFKSMKGLEAVGWINAKSEISLKISEILEFPNQIAKDRNLWMQKIVKHPLQENSASIANEIFFLE
jgi:hypothetical protein